jgi:hypothetical protein
MSGCVPGTVTVSLVYYEPTCAMARQGNRSHHAALTTASAVHPTSRSGVSTFRAAPDDDSRGGPDCGALLELLDGSLVDTLRASLGVLLGQSVGDTFGDTLLTVVGREVSIALGDTVGRRLAGAPVGTAVGFGDEIFDGGLVDALVDNAVGYGDKTFNGRPVGALAGTAVGFEDETTTPPATTPITTPATRLPPPCWLESNMG